MIIVATHKKFDKSLLLENYHPIQVGCHFSEVELGFLKDNDGENISHKNKSYCELTSLYCAWKNHLDNYDHLGLVHYRRFFVKDSLLAKFNLSKQILDSHDIERILCKFDVILPKKRFYPLSTVKQHYSQSHYEKDLLLLGEIISNDYPDYINSFNSVMNSRTIHLYNMFIMKSELVNDYCNWLFEVLAKLEDLVDISDYDSYQARIFGFLSERLLNVWVTKNQLRVKELNVYEPDGRRYAEKAIKYIKEYR